MPHTVFVTGASGYIAKHIVAKLLAAGHTVVGSVRRIERGDEVRAAVAPHVAEDALGRLRFVALDLSRDDGWADALQGCDVLMHTASPFPLEQPKDADEAIRPAVDGTLRALKAAQAGGTGRVILTSSTVSVTSTDLPPGRDTYTEEDWSDTARDDITPYGKSKTLAERAAWDFVWDEAPDLKLTVINPAFVQGTPLDAQFGTSVKLIERLLQAKDPALPQFGFPTVDVRDVAEAHVRAMGRPETAGKRYIIADRFLWFYEMAEILKAEFPDRKIVTRRAPNWFVRILARFDPSIRTIVPSLGKREEVSNARAKAGLGIDFTDARESVKDTARYLIAQKLV